MENSDTLINFIKRSEGCSLKPYRCQAGYLTIGYGRNLETNGISQAEADSLLQNDLARAMEEVKTIDGFSKFDSIVKLCLTDMAFNMGISRLKKFKKMLNAFKYAHYSKGLVELIDSKWFTDVGIRAKRILVAIGYSNSKLLEYSGEDLDLKCYTLVCSLINSAELPIPKRVLDLRDRLHQSLYNEPYPFSVSDKENKNAKKI